MDMYAEGCQCPICNNTDEVTFSSNSLYECPICGKFQMPIIFDISKSLNDDLRLKVRYAVKKNNLEEENKGLARQSLILTEEKLQEIDATYNIPKLLDKIDLVLEYIESKTDFISQEICIDFDKDFPLFFCKNNYELTQIIKYLKEEKYVTLNREINGKSLSIATKNYENDVKKYSCNYYCHEEALKDKNNIINYNICFVKYGKRFITLTTKALEYLAKKGKNSLNSKQAFVAMWFNDKEHEDKIHFRPDMQSIYTDAIKPAIEDGKRFESIKIDNVEHTNDINDEMIAQIRKSRFMVADLTGYRGGVYWEAGFAYGLGMPVIYTCHKEWLETNKGLGIEGVHFDLSHRNIILWDDTEEGLKKFQNDLKNRIEAIIV